LEWAAVSLADTAIGDEAGSLLMTMGMAAVSLADITSGGHDRAGVAS